MYLGNIAKSLKDKKLYIGYTSDLKNRYKQHKTELFVYYEAYVSEKDARKRKNI